MLKNTDGSSFDPVDYYKGPLREAFNEEIDKFFDELVTKSQIVPEENEALAKKVDELKLKLNDLSSKNGWFKFLRGFLIFIIVICFLAAIFGIVFLFSGSPNPLFSGLTIGIGIPLGVALIILIVKVINKKINDVSKKIKKIQAEHDEKLAICKSQIAKITNQLTFKDFINIVNRTSDVFTLDSELDPKKLLMVHALYNYDYEYTENESVVGVQSGDINTNPFIRVNLFARDMKMRTYRGTRTVSYTVTHYSNGKSYTSVVTETLVATVTKQAPEYFKDTAIIYGNEAAEHLSFIRRPTFLAPGCDEADIKKEIKEGTKTINSLTKEAVKKGKTFQPLGNQDFDALFGAFNRDNEVEFRLLFTPLAQQNLKEVMTDAVGFGDDFYFRKINKLNIVSTEHAKRLFEYNPHLFDGEYKFSNLTKNFKTHLKEIYRSLYFDLAPLLAIPLYQMTEGGEFNYNDLIPNVSPLEAESFVNEYVHGYESEFRPENSGPNEPLMLKVKLNSQVNKTDIYDVEAHTYQVIPQVEYVPVMAGNGSLYDVPVYWNLYIPTSKVSQISIHKFDLDDNAKTSIDDLNAAHINAYRKKNFIGFLTSQGAYSSEEDNNFVNYINDKFVKNKVK